MSVTEIAIMFAAWLSVVFLVVHDISEDWPSRQQYNSSSASQKNKNRHAADDSVPRPNTEESEQEHHNRCERGYWRLYVVLVFLGTSGAIFAAIYAGLAFNEARRQADAAFYTSRAWMEVTTDSERTNVSWTKDGLPTITTFLTATNIGESPAIGVFAFTRLHPTINILKSGNSSDCRSEDDYPHGHMVFMKEKYETVWSTGATQRDIDNFDDAYSFPRGKRWGPLDSFSPYDPVILTAAVCVKYKITGDIEWHHTSRFFSVQKIIPDEKGGTRLSNISFKENVPTGMVYLMKLDSGDDAD